MLSVNEMASVFCFAIEEGRVLEKELLLDGDRFVVRSDVYVTKLEAEEPKRVKEITSSLQFRMANLARLMEIFKRAAPSGTMCERSLVYILQDLASHGQEEGEPMLLPCCWYELRLSDVSRVIDRLFESVDYVDWREFLVHAMDLPVPTLREILAARDRFRAQDPDLREVVSLTQYHRTSLWFHDCSTESFEEFFDSHDEKLRQLLYDDATVSLRSCAQLFESCPSPEETLRRMLAKELLCRMYMTDRRSVNYTALLLAFCKDEKPRDGFAKALALALGSRVCADTEEGERYVKELVERKRDIISTSLEEKENDELLHTVWSLVMVRNQLPAQVAKMILKRLMRQIQRRIDGDSEDQESSLEDTNTFKLFGESVPDGVAEAESFGEYAWMESAPESVAEELVIYWLPLNTCITVLAAAVPWRVLNSEKIIGKCKTLAERLASVYEELRDVDLNDEKDVVLAHRLLNHEFMAQLLNTVGKFTVKSLASIVGEILLERRDA
ncbi:hypothetical protein E2986_11652 [Frieseomelitta varia]|uniref:SPEF2 C-terminal domain-containing protein n=1 Tax=Frieseomelitta varia TaxID=561572 RepID=A0A833R3W7_9HYME|nr:hypothetical protein E2986_11652 [Frieseomelitta varia]